MDRVLPLEQTADRSWRSMGRMMTAHRPRYGGSFPEASNPSRTARGAPGSSGLKSSVWAPTQGSRHWFQRPHLASMQRCYLEKEDHTVAKADELFVYIGTYRDEMAARADTTL